MMAHWVIGSLGRQGEKQLWMSEEELEGRTQLSTVVWRWMTVGYSSVTVMDAALASIFVGRLECVGV